MVALGRLSMSMFQLGADYGKIQSGNKFPHSKFWSAATSPFNMHCNNPSSGRVTING